MSNNKGYNLSNHQVIVKILKYGIFAAAFIPLIIFSQFISPFHFGKGIIFRSMVELMAVFYLVLIIKDSSYRPKTTKLFWAVTLFVAVFGLTTFISFDFLQSFWGTLERMGGFYGLIHFWIFFVISISILKTKEEWLWFIKLSLFASLISSFYGFLQRTDADFIIGSGGRQKIFGTIGNAALFAGYEIVNLFLALTLLFRPETSKNGRYFYGFVFLIGSLAVFLSGVRGSVLAVVIGIVLFGISYSLYLGSKKMKIAVTTFILLILISASTFTFLRGTDFVKNNSYLYRYSDFSLKTYTVQTRFWAWQAGLDGWNDSFKTTVLGWGPENFNYPFSVHFNPKFYKGPGAETLFDRGHNMFVEVLVTTGIIGLITYILIFAFSFVDLRKLRKKSEDNFMVSQLNQPVVSQLNHNENIILSIGLTAALVGYIIHNLFIFDTTANLIMFFLVLGFINYLSLESRLKLAPDKKLEIQKPKTNKKGLAYFAGVLTFVLAIFLIVQTNIQPARANYRTTRAIVASWNKDHDSAVEKFKEAMAFNYPIGRYEIRHRYARYIVQKAAQVEMDAKMQDALFVAIKNVKKNVEEHPNDYLPHLYISRAYIMLGRSDTASTYNDEALRHSLRALELSETFVRTYFEIAQAYLNKKDLDGAIKYFKIAEELNPEVSLTKWYLGITYSEKGEIEKAIDYINKAFESGYDPSESDLLRVINVYLKIGDFKKIVELYEQLIELSPKKAQYFASLAVVYGQIGEIEKAIAAAQHAIELDSTFKEEAEQFIESLR